MSLQEWSLVVFGSTAFMYLMAYFSLFHNPSIKKFILFIFAWVVHMVVTLWYGIATEQIGFVLIFGLEIAIIFFVYIITGKVLNYVDQESP